MRIEDQILDSLRNGRALGTTETERVEYRRLVSEGYTVLKRGCPDFFAFKEVPGGVEFCFIEVKNESTDRLSDEQIEYIGALRKCGIPVKVTWYTTVELKRVEAA
jgi:hypothetical protein